MSILLYRQRQGSSEGDSSGSVAQDIFATCIFVFLIMIMYLFTNRGADQVSERVVVDENYSSKFVLGIKSRTNLGSDINILNAEPIAEAFTSDNGKQTYLFIDPSLADGKSYEFGLSETHKVSEFSLEGPLGRYVIEEAVIINCKSRLFSISLQNKIPKCINL